MTTVRVLLALAVFPALAADWPQWRGPKRDGSSSETGLLAQWPAAGPKLVWTATGLGEGYSSFAVVGNRIYTQGQRGAQEFVIAFDAATGKEVWRTPAGGPFRERRGHGPRATPTVEGTRLWALSADGTLVSLDTASGKPFWSINILEKFGGSQITWGISESPLIDGAKVIVTPGGRGAGVVALNKLDGSLIWKSQNDTAGYSSAIAYDAAGKRQIAVLTSDAAMGLDASNGNLLWRYTKVANNVANIATPIHRDGHVFVSTDYGTGCALLNVSSGNAEEVYFNRDMKNHYSSSVLIGNTLYGYSSQILTAMNFKTGQVLWRDRSVGKGSVTFAEGHLYVFGENGQVALVEASPEAYKEKSRFSIDPGSFPTWTPPVIANGRMYLREQDKLYSFDIKR